MSIKWGDVNDMKKDVPSRTLAIIQGYANELRNIYGDKLMNVTLFGSYARGDFTEESDIDIFVVVDLNDDAINALRKALVHLTFETNMEHDVDIAPIVMRLTEYHHWASAHPLLKDVQKDGVSLYEAA